MNLKITKKIVLIKNTNNAILPIIAFLIWINCNAQVIPPHGGGLSGSGGSAGSGTAVSMTETKFCYINNTGGGALGQIQNPFQVIIPSTCSATGYLFEITDHSGNMNPNDLVIFSPRDQNSNPCSDANSNQSFNVYGFNVNNNKTFKSPEFSCSSGEPINMFVAAGNQFAANGSHTLQIKLRVLTAGGCDTIDGDSTLSTIVVYPGHTSFSGSVTGITSITGQRTFCLDPQSHSNTITLCGNPNDPNLNYVWVCNSSNVSLGAGGPCIHPTMTSTSPPPNVIFQLQIAQSVVFANPPGSCLFDTDTFKVFVYTSPVTITAIPPPPVCAGTPVTLTASGATSGYSWSTGQTGSSIIVNPPNPNSANTFGVNFTGGGGCSFHQTIDVNTFPSPIFKVTTNPVNAAVCRGNPITINLQNGINDTINYSITGGNLNNYSCGPNSCNVTDNPTTNGTYVITATNKHGCKTTQTLNVILKGTAAIIGLGSNPSTATVIPTFNLCQLNTSASTFFSSINSSTYSWSISPNDGNLTFVGGNTNSQTISLLANNPNKNQTYILTLTTTDFLPGGGTCNNSSTIQIKPCCSPAAYPGYTAIGNGTGISSLTGLPNGNYIITGQIDVGFVGVLSPLTSFSNSNFIMNPGSQIVLENNLSLTNCHLYGCSDMWEGIAFAGDNVGVNTNPSLTVNSSLIEDAKYAINVASTSANVPTAAIQPTINLNKVWFNRCAVGIANDFDPLSTAGLITPFNSNLNVANSVFTCRKNVTMAMVQSTATPKGNTSALATLQPDNLRNFNYKTSYYSFTSIAAGMLTYNGGSGTARTINNCFFDWQMDGILSGGDLTVQKCTFQDMLLISGSANEADVLNNLYAQQVAASNLKVGSGINHYGSKLTAGGNTPNANNFTICNYGIITEPDGASPINIANNNFNLTVYSGVYLTSIGAMANHSIINNNFTNHFYQGVNAFFVPSPFVSGGSLNINNNTFNIVSAFYSFFSLSYFNLPEAIAVASQPTYANIPVTNSRVNINANTITNYQLGIRAQSAPISSIKNNTISMYEDNVISVANFTHGISMTHCDGSTISQNDISSINTVNTWKYGQFGIFTENSINSLIRCNHINGPDVALKCQGAQNTSSISENTMQNAAIVSFWLDNYGFVGPQGHSGFPGFTNANKFISVGQFAAYASNGSNGNNSPFYYINSGVNKPIPSDDDHLTNIPNPGTKIPTGGVYALTPFALSPLPCPIINILGGFGQPAAVLANGVAQRIASNSISFPQFNSTAAYGNKLDLLRTLVGAGPSSYNADATLTSFISSMNGTSQASLLQADTLLANAGTDSAKINAALVVNSSVAPVDNYDTYLKKMNEIYGSFVKQRKRLTQPEISTLKSIAQLCPYEYGEGVYRARALLSRFDTLHYWNSCELNNSLSQSGARIAHTNESNENILLNSELAVYPNPVSTDLFIEGLQSNENDVAELIVFNSIGEVVLKNSLRTSDASTQAVDVSNLKAGTYFFKINVNGVTQHYDKLIIMK